MRRRRSLVGTMATTAVVVGTAKAWAERWTAQPIKRLRHNNKLRHSSSRWPTCRRSRPSSLRNSKPWPRSKLLRTAGRRRTDPGQPG